jgi:phosphomannomutase/phosphoglucomutase
MKIMELNEKIFREYDIRGIVGKDLDPDVAVSIGKGFGSYIIANDPSARSVSVGRDVRLSSKELSDSLIEGIIASGLDVYDIGECPTPLQYFSLHQLDVSGGIMVTGSHNPPEYNGFKISIGKGTIFGRDIQKLRKFIVEQKFIKSDEKGNLFYIDILKKYKEYMLREFSYLRDKIYKKIRIVIDAGNGTAGLIVPEILELMGCEVTKLYCDPDGTFPNHHPDPTVVENIQDLIGLTKESNADLGVGYDGDSDRIGIVNNNGDIIWGDQLMIILSRAVLKENPGAKIIGDVKCSQNMFRDIKKNGGVPIMWKTGHSLIKDKMKTENALMAGEFSGHIFIGDRYYGYDDAIYTTLRLIEIMKVSGKGIDELLSDIPWMHFTPEIRIECPDDVKKDVVEKITNKLKKKKNGSGLPFKILGINDIDGVRIEFENGWGLIRTSNTQPVIVMRVEATDEKRLVDYRSFLEAELNEARETV